MIFRRCIHAPTRSFAALKVFMMPPPRSIAAPMSGARAARHLATTNLTIAATTVPLTSHAHARSPSSLALIVSKMSITRFWSRMRRLLNASMMTAPAPDHQCACCRVYGFRNKIGSSPSPSRTPPAVEVGSRALGGAAAGGGAGLLTYIFLSRSLVPLRAGRGHRRWWNGTFPADNERCVARPCPGRPMATVLLAPMALFNWPMLVVKPGGDRPTDRAGSLEAHREVVHVDLGVAEQVQQHAVPRVWNVANSGAPPFASGTTREPDPSTTNS